MLTPRNAGTGPASTPGAVAVKYQDDVLTYADLDARRTFHDLAARVQPRLPAQHADPVRMGVARDHHAGVVDGEQAIGFDALRTTGQRAVAPELQAIRDHPERAVGREGQVADLAADLDAAQLDTLLEIEHAQRGAGRPGQSRTRGVERHRAGAGH